MPHPHPQQRRDATIPVHPVGGDGQNGTGELRPLPAWHPLATMALHEAIRGHNERAAKALQRLHDEHGAEDLPLVMLAWIDTMLANIPTPPADVVGIAFRKEGSDTITFADGVSPEVAFAGRLIAARANDDQIQFGALIDSVPSDEQWGRNVFAVLSIVAANLRMAGQVPEPAHEETP